MENKKLIAFDLDGTLTQHKTPLDLKNRSVLERLSKKYKLLMVGAGQCMRIFNQLDFPIDIIGNYGMQYSVYNKEKHTQDMVFDAVIPCDKDSIEKRITMLREKFGFTEYYGENTEFHSSGCVTFPCLGTKAPRDKKLAFDPDRQKRRHIYSEVIETFPEFNVFVGGSSSFDMAPKPYNKYYALDKYCKDNGLSHGNVVYAGDDYGEGGNDEAVYVSDFDFIKVDDYTKLEEYLKEFLK